MAGHSIAASLGQLATVGAALSVTVMVWLQVAELLCASVAAQARLVLLTSSPLTVRAASAKVTVRLASQASLNTGVPKTGVAGHSILERKSVVEGEGVALCGSVMVWVEGAEVLGAAVAVQVRLALVRALPSAGRA